MIDRPILNKRNVLQSEEAEMLSYKTYEPLIEATPKDGCRKALLGIQAHEAGLPYRDATEREECEARFRGWIEAAKPYLASQNKRKVSARDAAGGRGRG